MECVHASKMCHTNQIKEHCDTWLQLLFFFKLKHNLGTVIQIGNILMKYIENMFPFTK